MGKNIDSSFGERLSACLVKGIDYLERHKGRARLVRDLPERIITSARVHSDILAAINRLDRRSEPIFEVHVMLRRLKKILRQLDSEPVDEDTIPEWVWAALNVPEDYRRLETPDDYLEFSWKIWALIEHEKNSPVAHLTSPRGPRTDQRLRALLSDLANVYWAYTGFRATATESKDGSGMKGPFFDFIHIIFQHYVDRPVIDEWLKHSGKLNSAIRIVASDGGRYELAPIAQLSNSEDYILFEN